MKKGIRKALSALLSMALVVTGMGVTAYAEEPAPGTGPCEHHTKHDESCGYAEAVPGHKCEHVHTDTCYEEVGVASPPEAVPAAAVVPAAVWAAELPAARRVPRRAVR